ncbi:substrate-binding periplasmic protein [Zooshikella sp. RANM57]|uniref:substrate-binding periplasmic protein n=1 Tax=Zooshikella sp. RANM57 TaxID=3425863 RepID=UPI003D6E5FFB
MSPQSTKVFCGLFIAFRCIETLLTGPKRRLFSSFFYGVLILIVGLFPSLLSPPSVAAEKKEMPRVLYVSDPWPPYILGDIGRPATGGVAVNFARELLKRLGFQMDTMLYPWEECLRMIHEHTADIVFPLIQTPERSGYMTFSQTVFISHDRVWYLRQRGEPVQWQLMSDLYPYRLATIRGYSHGVDMDKAIEENKFKEVFYGADHLENIAKLMNNEVDLMISDEQVMQDIIRRHPKWRDKFSFARKAISKSQYKIAFSKGSKLSSRIDDINLEIKRMRSDGSLRKIFSNY